MTITREQVADLQPGDVVEIRYSESPGGTFVQGPLYSDDGSSLYVGGHCVRYTKGEPLISEKASLTVVSRAPRPLYVNHPRTEPVPGDVVRNADVEDWNGWIYLRTSDGHWVDSSRGLWDVRGMPARLRLLVDGETGQVVP